VPLLEWARAQRARFDDFLSDRYQDVWPASFAAPLRYPVFGGGKRFRPLATLAAFEAVAGDPTQLSRALPAAAAVELVHTYSLVHDDLPAMDDDDERRGRPTVHVKWDDATAILVGDALLTDAFAVLADAPWSAEARIAAVAELARASGHLGMVGGQVADITGGVTDEATLTRLHRLKTGALIGASATLGGIAGGADAAQLAALGEWGRAVGLAFQLADDRLDADEDAGDDGPPSYVKLLGLDATRARARALIDEAVAAASTLPRPDRLVQLARYTIERDV
jgi:geranylgeranyl pyrophosphate synthase